MKAKERVMVAMGSLGREATGWEIAKEDQRLTHSPIAMGYGTLYRALSKCVASGQLERETGSDRRVRYKEPAR